MKRAMIHRRTIMLIALGLTLLRLSQPAHAVQGGQSPDRIWRLVAKDSVTISVSQLASLQQAIPTRFEVIRLDRQRLAMALNPITPRPIRAVDVPQRPPVEITLPLPDRTFARFRAQESSIMEPGLESQFPNFESYRAQGIDDPTMTARFSQTPDGFRAIVLSPDRTFFIDPFPLRPADRETYITYFKADLPADEKQLQCLVNQDAEGEVLLSRRAGRAAPLSNGDTLRTYRLAVAATGEYTKFHGGKENAFKAIYNTIDRVNGIFERDLSISLRLIGQEDKIIYTDAARDPYTNSNAKLLLSENQVNLDAVIGTEKYDIGHVFCVGGGGVAILRSVGKRSSKAKGATGSKNPVGDPFDVDYVAHEMGHQFGANHTFNATTGNCGEGTRNPTTAYEPGSGSTIMGYAGICRESNLQLNSHSYFHVASLEEIIDYVTSDEIKSVPSITPTNNRPPRVVAGQNIFIPKRTPFALRATGTDLDGDALTYTWEQYDLGAESPPEDDLAAVRPIFRSFPPERNALRFFPRRESLVSGNHALGESLPTQHRVMTFRVTARDNRAAGGGFSYATTSVSVVTDSGPFDVTRPAAAAVWTVGSLQDVEWNVAGTSDAPVSCHNVRVSLSLDGGKTFTVLVPRAANMGKVTVTVPNKPTVSARIMVEAVDNAFFNISVGDFSIVRR